MCHMIWPYYRCCCINEPIIFSHCVYLKLGHRFHALLKVCSDSDNIVPFIISKPHNSWCHLNLIFSSFIYQTALNISKITLYASPLQTFLSHFARSNKIQQKMCVPLFTVQGIRIHQNCPTI